MAFDSFTKKSEPEETTVTVKTVAPGTVLVPFHGKVRRFAVEYVVVDADIPDLPLSIEDLRARKLIA